MPNNNDDHARFVATSHALADLIQFLRQNDTSFAAFADKLIAIKSEVIDELPEHPNKESEKLILDHYKRLMSDAT